LPRVTFRLEIDLTNWGAFTKLGYEPQERDISIQ